MSFILDALRKSEHDRQRQTGPALAEVAVAPPKPGKNVWAPVAMVLLLVNLAVIGVLLIRKAAHEPSAAAATTAAPAGVAATAGQPVGPAPTVTAPAVATPAVSGTAPVTQAPPAPAQAIAPVAPVGDATRNPLEAEAGGTPPMLDPSIAARAAAAPPGPPAVMRMPASRGSVVYESVPDDMVPDSPVPASPPKPARSPSGGSVSSSSTRLPSADELVASGIPTLNLDLHVYSTTPSERLVFVNSHKYKEGDTMQEGPVVRQITPSGAVLEYNGRDYLLTNR